MGVTLDDLRKPEFNGRVWGYDRVEVDQLLASVITSIERLQSRRERDAAAVERATGEAAEARARAERAEQERDDLAIRLELALQQSPDGRDRGGDGASGAGGDGAGGDEARTAAAAAALTKAERRVAEATARAGQAERQVLVLREEVAEQRARTGRLDVAEAEVGELRRELAQASEPARHTEALPEPVAVPARLGERSAANGATVSTAGRSSIVAGATMDDLDAALEGSVLLPLAQRAARALLREARTTAAGIVAEAEQQAAMRETLRD